MTERTYNVLFLCTGNTARSILAEGILRKDGAGRFNAFSAGSQPKGTVNPLALKTLGAHDYPADGYRSKNWDEFAEPNAPVMDFVITVCDNAAGEACPIWPGHPSVAHWGIEDPAAVQGSDMDKERAFEQAFRFLNNRIGTFISLPLASLDQFTIGTRLREIGHLEGASIGVAPENGPQLKMTFFLAKRIPAEALGTGFLVATVVGSGIMADKLAGGNTALALLGNTLPTGAILVALILALAPVSGAHINPAVSLVESLTGGLPWRGLAPYVLAQVVGGCLGTFAAHGMFDLALVQASATARTGAAQWLGEFVATFGLLMTILAVERFRIEAIPFAVGLYITAAYWFTSSTSFANPAVTIARSLTATFAGIAPASVPAFILAQLLGGLAVMALTRWLLDSSSRSPSP